MKKIVLGSIFLLVLCAGIARADLVRPGTHPWWQGLDTLSEEEKLQECQQLKKTHPNIENERAVLPTKKKWDMLKCEELLKKHAEKQAGANPQTDPGTTEDKHDMRDYGLAGLLVLLLSGGAFVLLWRSRKTMPRAL